MNFTDYLFIPFIIAVAAFYFTVPRKVRWVVLLAASYCFYWLNSHGLLIYILLTTVISFCAGLGIEKLQNKSAAHLKDTEENLTKGQKKKYKEKAKRRQRAVLLAGILPVLGFLVYLKYFNFIADNLNAVFDIAQNGMRVQHHSILLPLGISFYTLQAIAYMADVYRGKTKADKNLFRFMLFISFFPQILQGPIPRYRQLAHQLYEGHLFSYKRLAYGSQLILWGFMKKLIIADRIAIPVKEIFDNYTMYRGAIVFLGAAMYGIQVYTDFSGGMDIARGIAQILGIDLELNFKQPYFATSIEDFWRRWHISLGQWMKDYVFYPLALSRPFTLLGKITRKVLGSYVGKRVPSFLAMFIVYFCVGIWHGAKWNFIAYGIWNGIFIAAGILLENAYGKVRDIFRIKSESASWHIFQIVRTFFLVSIGRYLSRADGFSEAIEMMANTAKGWWKLSFITDGSLFNLGLDNANWILLLAAVLVLLLVDYYHERNVCIRDVIADQAIIFRWIVYFAALVCVLIFGVYGPGYNSADFIYGQF